MCGRFTLTLDPMELRQAFDLGDLPPEWIPRYNVAPSQPVAVVADAVQRKVDFMRWGLVPSWAKDLSIGNKLINARSETIVEKPSFRSAFARRRCLVLADGFFEWTKPDKVAGQPAIPHYFQLRGGKPFAFAGLWELWREPEGDSLKSCTIITCAANPLVAKVHERMPVILDPTSAWDWLAESSTADLLALLRPYSAEEMTAHPVSRAVNDPKHDHLALIQPG